MIYRIYTEDLNREEVLKIVSNYYDGFTVFRAKGFWKVHEENSIVIEILEEFGRIDNSIIKICEEIKKLNVQEKILVVKIKEEHCFI